MLADHREGELPGKLGHSRDILRRQWGAGSEQHRSDRFFPLDRQDIGDSFQRIVFDQLGPVTGAERLWFRNQPDYLISHPGFPVRNRDQNARQPQMLPQPLAKKLAMR